MLRRLIATLFFLSCIGIGTLFYLFEKEWVDFSTLGYYSPAKPSIVLDEEGREIGRYELDRRDPVTYDKMPDMLIKAFVAAEDHRFFEHAGVSFKGMLRSFLVNLYHGRVVQGASTITQQLARGMFLYHDRTIWRKVQEIFIALQLERQLSKEQIMELYLNNIYFGRGTYGVEAACRRFWNKSLSQITIAEAATLAAVAASARLYSPLNAPCSAKKRRNVIIGSMLRLGFITNKECERAKKEKLTVLDLVQGNPIRLYILEWIRAWAESMWGKEALYRKGLRIQTSINLDVQAAAEKSFANVVTILRKKIGSELNGGLVSMEPSTGQIKAFIGGFNFKESQFNRAFQAHRQMGSIFKPFIYAYALEHGIELDRVMVDEPIEFTISNGQTWTPKNWTNRFDGPMTLARALTLSNNIITIKLFLELGIQNIVEWAKRFGFKNAVPPYPSAALGTTEVSVEENCAAFNMFANNGMYVKPYLVEWVKDEWGAKLWEYEPVKYRVISSKVASKMINALSHRMAINKQRSVQGWFDVESIGKTGSTNGAATTWFAGSTPGLTTAVYIGRDDNKQMGSQVFASATVFPVWLGLYTAIPHQKKHFYLDPNLKETAIDWVSGQETDSTLIPNGHDMKTIKILKG